MFSAETYSSRRSILKDKFNDGVILLFGNTYLGMNYTDNTYHFRQDSSFLYYAGIDQANLALIIDCKSGISTLYGDELTMDDVVWTGPLPTLKSLAEKVGVEDVQPFANLKSDLHNINDKKRTIHYLPPYRHLNIIRLSEWLMIPTYKAVEYASKDLIKAIVNQREVKSEEELTEMEKAVNISGIMHKSVMRYARNGMQECELVGVIERIAANYDTHMAYGIILTKNGQTLHNHHHHNVIQYGDLVLGDYGAETNMHYAGDITRTFPVATEFTTQQKEVYNLVLEAEEYAISILRPGINYKTVHLNTCRLLAQGLSELGLMRGNLDDAVDEGAHALFMPHGLGHMIGLDVHDMEDFGEDYVGYSDQVKRSSLFGTAYLRLGKKLAAGNCLTVEPGLYFIPELIDQWRDQGKFTEFIDYNAVDKYRNLGGIRIEDNVVITKDGYRILGDYLLKTAGEIEDLRKG